MSSKPRTSLGPDLVEATDITEGDDRLKHIEGIGGLPSPITYWTA